MSLADEHVVPVRFGNAQSECWHDYDPACDYLVTAPDPAFADVLAAMGARVAASVLPLGAIRAVQVACAELGGGQLGCYVDGTSSEPVIVLDPDAHRAACARFDIPLQVAVLTTLVHELGHADQEQRGVAHDGPAAEAEAEALAQQWAWLADPDERLDAARKTFVP